MPDPMTILTIEPGQTGYAPVIPIDPNRAASLSIIRECSHAHGLCVLVSDQPEPPGDGPQWYLREWLPGLTATPMYTGLRMGPPQIIIPMAMRWVKVGITTDQDSVVTAQAQLMCEVIYA